MPNEKQAKRVDPKRAALVRNLRSTGYPEKSIYRWLANGRGPRDQYAARAWAKALANARAKLAKSTAGAA